MQIVYSKIDTPLGTMIAGATPNGICTLDFTDKKKNNPPFDNDSTNYSSGQNIFIETLKKELDEYFSKKRKNFSVPLDMIGTDFQKEVWGELLNIPYGETRSYLQQAAAIQKPTSVRAVANANSRNKIAIIIPCHRVIGANGTLTGYAGGLDRKKWLIDLEKKVMTI